jgi:protein tyrosine/serine phosphatase
MRPYSFEGVANFRDFGGYPTIAGGRVIGGRLFRGGHQGTATDSDVRQLDGLGIGLIVDLRRSFERGTAPRVWPKAGSAGLIADTTETSAAELPYNAFLRDPGVSPEDVVAHVRSAYRTIPYDPRHIALYSAYLQRLAAIDCASLVSCTHGKDRTGILCALTLSVLEVDPEAIFGDYLLTNAGLSESMSLEEAQGAFARTYDIKPSLGVMGAIINVKRVFLETAFEEMRARNGSVEGYLAMLGVTQALSAELRARYVSR